MLLLHLTYNHIKAMQWDLPLGIPSPPTESWFKRERYWIKDVQHREQIQTRDDSKMWQIISRNHWNATPVSLLESGFYSYCSYKCMKNSPTPKLGRACGNFIFRNDLTNNFSWLRNIRSDLKIGDVTISVQSMTCCEDGDSSADIRYTLTEI